MLYLGRQNYLEGIGIPSKPEDPESRFIYALVYDQYGKIVHGNLNYTIDGWKHWRTTPMRLIYGIQANGTWRGEIPTYVMPYTVLYNASFKDDLNYSVTKSGSYYPGNENIIRNGQGYNVTDRYILVGSQLNSPIPGKYNNFTAIVSDDGRKIQNVTLSIYKLNDGKWVKDRALQPVKMVKENRNKIYGHWNYLANIVIPNLPNTKLLFHSTVYDSKGHVNSANHSITIMNSSSPTSNEPELNTISVTKIFISNVGINNQTANIQIKLHGPKINNEYSTTPYNQRKNTIGKAQNLEIPIINIINNNTNTKSEEKEEIPGSFHNLTRSINSIGFGSFDAMVGSDKSSGIGLKPYTALLSGDPLAFPLDHYSVDLIIEIPFKHVHIQRDVKGVGTGELYKSGWNPPDPEIASCGNIHSNIMNFICDPHTGNDPVSNQTFVKIHMDFTRNDFSFWAIIFPILFIFFLLGIICFLEPKDHYLVARIAITLGVFAFVFTFDTILPVVKPDYIRNISTFADFLLKLVLVAAIASTISSVVGYRMAVTIERQQADKNKSIVTIESKKDKWINRIQKYSLYDLVALVFVSVIILKETVITNLYSLEYPYMVIYPVIIIVGLGWGLLSQFVYYQIIYRSRGRNT